MQINGGAPFLGESEEGVDGEEAGDGEEGIGCSSGCKVIHSCTCTSSAHYTTGTP